MPYKNDIFRFLKIIITFIYNLYPFLFLQSEPLFDEVWLDELVKKVVNKHSVVLQNKVFIKLSIFQQTHHLLLNIVNMYIIAYGVNVLVLSLHVVKYIRPYFFSAPFVISLFFWTPKVKMMNRLLFIILDLNQMEMYNVNKMHF